MTISKCNHIWVMYSDLTVHCVKCDESRNGDELLEELQETIEELERDKQNLITFVDELKVRIDKALKHLPEQPGMAMGFLLEDDDEQKEVHYQRLTAVEDLTLLEKDDVC